MARTITNSVQCDTADSVVTWGQIDVPEGEEMIFQSGRCDKPFSINVEVQGLMDDTQILILDADGKNVIARTFADGFWRWEDETMKQLRKMVWLWMK